LFNGRWAILWSADDDGIGVALLCKYRKSDEHAGDGSGTHCICAVAVERDGEDAFEKSPASSVSFLAALP
jgi:hypothetical protein